MADASVKVSPISNPQYRPRMMYFGITSGAAQIETLTFPAVAAATQADFVVVYNQAGESIAAYIDIDADGTEPTSVLYTGATHKVPIVTVTGDTAILVAAAYELAVSGVIDDVTFSDAAANGTCLVTQGVVGACSDAVVKNADGSGAGSITAAVGTQGLAVSAGNGMYDATITQAVTGVYVVTFDNAYLRAPEAVVTCKTDNRFARISASAVGSVTIEVQNIVGGATANGDFSLMVLGSDAKDAIIHP